MADQEPLALQEVLADERAAICAGGDPERALSALCISGGGIRSATFALGALQALAQHGLLAQFDYLSTVSGGGYIGGWLSAWIKREGIEKVVRQLRRDAPKTPEGEINPIQHLREYNNYLSPELGGFSADTWTLVATITRNIALNWLVLIPLLVGLLMAPRVLTAVAFLSQHYALEHPEHQRHVVDSWIVAGGLPAVMLLLFFGGMLNMWRYLPGIGGVNHTGAD
jgi:patatin-like phospholipase